jgi:DNA repair protein RadC
VTSYKPVYSLRLVRDRSVAYDTKTTISDPSSVATVAKPLIGDSAVEIVIALLLDQRHRLIGLIEIGRGQSDRCAVSVATIARAALLANATAIILCHNHPSGQVDPSNEDRELTDRVKNGLRLIGIELLDHVIVIESDLFVSLREMDRNW